MGCFLRSESDLGLEREWFVRLEEVELDVEVLDAMLKVVGVLSDEHWRRWATGIGMDMGMGMDVDDEDTMVVC